MKAVWTWFLSNALWTLAGSTLAASLVTAALQGLIAAPVGTIAALWVATITAFVAIVILVGRLWWPSAPLLVWGADIDPNDYLWDETRQVLSIRVTMTATPEAGSAMMEGRRYPVKAVLPFSPIAPESGLHTRFGSALSSVR